MADLAFQIPQYPQTGRLPWSLIFLDMISFIIHPSTAPLISSLSASHSSHFLPLSLLFFLSGSLVVHLSYVCHVVSSRYVSLPRSLFTFLTIRCCRLCMIYRVIQRGAWSFDCLSEGGREAG